MKLIDGKMLSAKVLAELKERVEKLKIKGVTPGLVVVLIGENPASQTYVRSKERRATELGINSKTIQLPESVSEQELLEVINQLNHDESWHGILVQLPLPKHISEEKVLLAISPEKDVDGFHPTNMGKLWSGEPLMLPSTPAGIMEMFKEYNIDLDGKNAVVIGRSNIVGKPMAQMMLMANATVTIAHSRTKDLSELTRSADILVVAIGQDRMIKAADIKEGAVVIDVGMNRDENGKLHGDVDFDDVKTKAGYLTPVPGGVGLMTVAMLMKQTVETAERLGK